MMQHFYDQFAREGYTREWYIAGISKSVCKLIVPYVHLFTILVYIMHLRNYEALECGLKAL